MTVGVLGAVGAVALAGVAAAASLGPGPVAAREVPVPLLGLALLAPGVLILVVAGRMPQQALRERWDDADWLRRFRGGLRTRLVAATTAQGHVVEVEQAMASGTSSAFTEFGHPLVLAREIADADRTARSPRWWVSTVARTSTPLVIEALVLSTGTYAALTIPVVGVLLLSAIVSLIIGWSKRPWANRQ